MLTDSGGADLMGLALLVALFGGVAYRWGGAKLTGIDGAEDDRPFVLARRGGPLVAALALLAFVGLAMARCSR